MYLFVLGKEHFLCQGLFCMCGIVAEGRNFSHSFSLESRRKRQGSMGGDTQAHPVKRREKSHPATGREKRRRNNDGTVQSGFYDLFQELPG